MRSCDECYWLQLLKGSILLNKSIPGKAISLSVCLGSVFKNLRIKPASLPVFGSSAYRSRKPLSESLLHSVCVCVCFACCAFRFHFPVGSWHDPITNCPFIIPMVWASWTPVWIQTHYFEICKQINKLFFFFPLTLIFTGFKSKDTGSPQNVITRETVCARHGIVCGVREKKVSVEVPHTGCNQVHNWVTMKTRSTWSESKYAPQNAEKPPFGWRKRDRQKKIAKWEKMREIDNKCISDVFVETVFSFER